jgi:hypothetical protein
MVAAVPAEETFKRKSMILCKPSFSVGLRYISRIDEILRITV